MAHVEKGTFGYTSKTLHAYQFKILTGHRRDLRISVASQELLVAIQHLETNGCDW